MPKTSEPTISTADALDIFVGDASYRNVRVEGPAEFAYGKYAGTVGIRVSVEYVYADEYRGIEAGERVGFVAIRRPNGKRFNGYDAESLARVEAGVEAWKKARA